MPGLFARVWNALATGSVTASDDTGTIMQLQIKLSALETHMLPNPQHFGFSSVPPIGSDVAAHYIGGDRSNGLIQSTNHQTYRPKGKQPGETIIYDAFGKSIYLTASGGIVVEANNTDVTVNNATTLTINAATAIIANTPVLKCSGDIIDNYGSNTRTMATMRSIYDGHTHNVPDVQTGGSTVPTLIPNQQE
jgi:phage baseplate assembly protein V